jgi:hypothetical protein
MCLRVSYTKKIQVTEERSRIQLWIRIWIL